MAQADLLVNLVKNATSGDQLAFRKAAEGVQIPIYEQLRTRLQPQVAVSAVQGTR